MLLHFEALDLVAQMAKGCSIVSVVICACSQSLLVALRVGRNLISFGCSTCTIYEHKLGGEQLLIVAEELRSSTVIMSSESIQA